MKKRSHPFPGRILLTVCTCVLVLAFSALPALALWADDARQLAQPHARTSRAGTLALTGDDLYLTRILKKYSQRDATIGYQSAETYLDGMDVVEAGVLRGYLDVLCEVGVLPAEWRDYCAAYLSGRVLSSTDSLGFTHYICYNKDETAKDYACYVVGITVERESRKVVALWASAPRELPLPEAEILPTLEAYCAYLEVDALGGWENPVDTQFEDAALYSPRAELMLFCENGVYWPEDYRSYSMFGGTYSTATYERSYLCLNAISIPEETVRAWQAYARSFPEGTPLWGRRDADDPPDAEIKLEEALG